MSPRPARRQWFWIALLLVVALPLVAAGLLAGRARYVPPDLPVDTSPEAVIQARRSVETVTETLQEAEEAAAKGEERSYRVEVRQPEANTLLRTDPRVQSLLKKHQVERPRLEIKDGRLTAGGLVTYRGQRVYVTAEGAVETGEGGRLQFRPEQVWLGQVAAPQAVTEEMARRLAEAFASQEIQLPGQVESVRLEDGRLVIEGTTAKEDNAPAAPAG